MSLASPLSAQTTAAPTNSLDAKQVSMVKIAAFTAVGDISQLKQALSQGLTAGLTVNESKEMLVQLYAYCGFPRSLNALTTLMNVLEDRNKKGIVDVAGRDASPVNDTDKYTKGKETLAKLTRTSQDGPLTGVNAFAPAIDTFLKEHLFADIFSRDVLTYQQRELVTIAALISMNVPQMKSHMSIGLNVGLTASQLTQAIEIIKNSIGQQPAEAGKEALKEISSANPEKR